MSTALPDDTAERGADSFDEFSFLPVQAAEIGRVEPPPRVRRVRLGLPDGRTLSALRYGDSPPVATFLHGAGLNAHTWDTTVLALGLPALAIDLAGHGDSSWRDDLDYSPATLAQDVVAAVDAWTDRPQLLVGHSLGGLTAAAVAAARADLVDRLVIVDITPGVNPDAGPRQVREFFAGPTDWASRDELVDRALAFGLGGSRDAAARGVYLNSRVRADGRVEWKHHFAHLAAAAAAASASSVPTPGAGDPVRNVLSHSGWDDLAAVHSPVLLIRGAEGYVTEADAEEFGDRHPTAAIVVVDSHHNVHEEIPVRLAELLRDEAALLSSSGAPTPEEVARP
ncbi:alpha/beta hydrolase [Microbacterium sp. cx-55]|uniref:alpha/beta fold hydrolase n=1 Tax=Microbacterium sp. cx-55 TaxID=2875948 RepID=UPI001CC019A2|nr:alpha/beta hydrolase [Microbacterium sp. cx-55]MBZ4488687.1 alpha/beta hydrolase [Microbacterium sp. cx-55]UGB36660.1 alpha/beta hydrolase [Microbacterium sp. cx-55]